MSTRIKIDRKGLRAATEAMACFTSYDTPNTLAEDCIRAYLEAALSTEPGEAKGVVLTASEAEKICKRLEFDASWDKCGSGYYSLKRQLSAAPLTEDTRHG